jgi:hypothetical protein
MKTLSKPSLPKIEPKPTSREAMHYDLFKVALQGFCAGAEFHSSNADGLIYNFDSRDQLRLVKHLSFLAWNASNYACQMFEENEELQDFSNHA